MSRYIDADKLLEGRSDHELISIHLIWNAPVADVVSYEEILKVADGQEKQGFIQTAEVLRDLVGRV